jgi:hypothetical protein
MFVARYEAHFYQQGLTTKIQINLLYIYCDVQGSLNRWLNIYM